MTVICFIQQWLYCIRFICVVIVQVLKCIPVVLLFFKYAIVVMSQDIVSRDALRLIKLWHIVP